MPTQNVSMSDWVYSRIRRAQDELGGSFSAALVALVKVADAHLTFLEESAAADAAAKKKVKPRGKKGKKSA